MIFYTHLLKHCSTLQSLTISTSPSLLVLRLDGYATGHVDWWAEIRSFHGQAAERSQCDACWYQRNSFACRGHDMHMSWNHPCSRFPYFHWLLNHIIAFGRGRWSCSSLLWDASDVASLWAFCLRKQLAMRVTRRHETKPLANVVLPLCPLERLVWWRQRFFFLPQPSETPNSLGIPCF